MFEAAGSELLDPLQGVVGQGDSEGLDAAVLLLQAQVLAAQVLDVVAGALELGPGHVPRIHRQHLALLGQRQHQ